MQNRTGTLKDDSGIWILLLLFLIGTYLTSWYSSLVFHTMAELFSILVAISIFIVAWNTRKVLDNNYLLVLGIAFLFIGGIDLVHALAYSGMNIFSGFDANLSTRLWIAARYLQALTLLFAPLAVGRNVRPRLVLAGYTAVFSLLMLSILYWQVFPVCYFEGQGLTPFKVYSEYLICILLAGAAAHLWIRRESFERRVFALLLISIVATIVSEICFTFYAGVYDFSNLIGHLMKIVSISLVYIAIVESGIRKPYTLLYRNLAQSEHRLRQERDRIALYLNVAGVMILVLDTDGTVQLINRKGVEILGYESEKEIVGKDWFEYFLRPDTAEDVRQVFGQIVRGELENVENFENEVLRKDGARRLISWYNTMLRDENGAIVGTVSSGRDITRRRQAEDELARSHKELIDIIDSLPDATFVFDSERRIIAWNRAIEEMTGVGKDEILGKACSAAGEAFYGENKPVLSEYLFDGLGGLDEAYESVIRNHTTLTAETRSDKLYGGRGAYILSTASLLYDEEGRTIGAIESAHDITQRKISEKALQETNRKLNILSSITRHDILNQVQIMLLRIALFREMIADKPEALGFLNECSNLVETITRQITFTRDYQDLGVKAPSWQPVRRVAEMAGKSVHLPEGMLAVETGDLQVFADPMFGKVFYNLFDNAVRHGEHVTRITVTAREEDDRCVLTVADNGTGILEEDKNKLFMRGFGKNTGFGLFLSREILDITGVSIAENGVPGSGARFEMTIPPGAWRKGE